MKSEFDEPAYKLSWDVAHFERNGILDWNKDIVFEEYDNYVSYEYFENEPFYHPNPVIFTAYLPVVKFIDYPQPDNEWNVMSRRMYEILLSVGEFPHRIIPVAIVDAQVQREDWYDANGELKKEICLWNYLAVQLTEHLDIFDYEKSEYDRDEHYSQIIRFIDKYVFRIPEKGLPPIFKIPEKMFSIFISAEARAALKKAKINGTRYQSRQALGTSFLDHPVVLPDEAYL